MQLLCSGENFSSDVFFYLGFTPYEAEQQLQDMEVQDKVQKDENDIRKLLRKKQNKKGVYCL